MVNAFFVGNVLRYKSPAGGPGELRGLGLCPSDLSWEEYLEVLGRNWLWSVWMLRLLVGFLLVVSELKICYLLDVRLGFNLLVRHIFLKSLLVFTLISDYFYFVCLAALAKLNRRKIVRHARV